MVEFEVKVCDNKAYLKEELMKVLPTNPLKAIPNAKAVVLFPNNIDLKDVKKSLELILADVQSRLGENP